MQIQPAAQPFQDVEADALVVPLFEDEKPATGPLAIVDAALNGALSRAVDYGETKGKRYEMVTIYAEGRIRAPRVLLIGAGKESEYSAEYARHVASAAVRHLTRRRASRVAYYIRDDRATPPEVRAAVEGAVYATFQLDEYKTREREENVVAELILVGPGISPRPELDEAVAAAHVTAEATNFARELVNEPANKLTPAAMVERARATAQEYGLDIDVFDRQRMSELSMGGLLGVAEGSSKPPYLIVMRYRPTQAASATLALVGKGITFDTGGISIKPAEGMHLMKTDMSGAAACLAAMRALAVLKPMVAVVAALPMTENMPGGDAMRPGDVLTTMSGQTVEVQNTDAEGRLVLCDALTYVQQKEGASHIVDVATLTGACVVALGNEASGVMGAPQEWVDFVIHAGREAGEKMWQLPLYPEYADQIRSKIADVKNVGGRPAGTITAALFLKEFVQEGVKWAHLDIAGTAWAEKSTAHRAEGPTGIPVRTLVNIALQM